MYKMALNFLGQKPMRTSPPQVFVFGCGGNRLHESSPMAALKHLYEIQRQHFCPSSENNTSSSQQ